MYFIRLLAGCAFLSLLAAPALADKPGFGDTFTFKVGGMDYNVDAKFSSTREGNEEIDLDLDDLGMDTTATNIWLGFNWQFADSWGLSGSYSKFSGDGEARAEADGNFEDIEWSVNATLDSELDLKIYIVDLSWDFINTERSHIGVGVGLHIADIKTGIAARVEADVNGMPVDPPIDLGASSTSVTAPLPNFSVNGGHRFGDSFFVGARVGYFALKVDDIDGELITASLFGEWRPGGGKLGVGLGYQLIDVDVKEDGANKRTKLDLTGDGPILYVSLGL